MTTAPTMAAPLMVAAMSAAAMLVVGAVADFMAVAADTSVAALFTSAATQVAAVAGIPVAVVMAVAENSNARPSTCAYGRPGQWPAAEKIVKSNINTKNSTQHGSMKCVN